MQSETTNYDHTSLISTSSASPQRNVFCSGCCWVSLDLRLSFGLKAWRVSSRQPLRSYLLLWWTMPSFSSTKALQALQRFPLPLPALPSRSGWRYWNSPRRPSGSSAAASRFTSVCLCMKVLFVLVDVDEPRNGRLLEYFRVRDFEAPLIRLVNLTNHVTYQLPSDTLDPDTIKTFCQSYLDGTAKVASTYICCVRQSWSTGWCLECATAA